MALGRGLSALISTPPVVVRPPDQNITAHDLTSNLSSKKVVPMTRTAASVGSSIDPFSRGERPDPALSRTSASVEGASVEGASGDGTSEIESQNPRVAYVSVFSLRPNPNQPRQDFSEPELEELATSIRTVGLLQPIVVRPVSDGAAESQIKYEIVAGERRWRASQRAGLEVVPVISRPLTDREALELGLIENLQRENLNPVEHAIAYQRLAQDFNLGQAEIAERVGKDRASVANFMRLLKLPQDVLDYLRAGTISMGHAKAILSVREPSAQSSLARKVAMDGLSVRALEALVARVVVLDTGRRVKTSLTTDGVAGQAAAGQGGSHERGGQVRFPEVTDKLRRALGTKVSILHTKSGRGRIEIEYFSEDELDRLVEHITRPAPSAL